MATPDLTLQPGDILRGTVERVDASSDACYLNAGSHGYLLVPLAGLADAAVGRLVPGACACVQVLERGRGQVPPKASTSIEFAGRTSVLVLDGTAVAAGDAPGARTVFVSKKLAGVRRAELAARLESALKDESCGLPAMLDAVGGSATIVLRTAADETPWDRVLSSIVVQATEAAAFSVVAGADSSPALLMAEKPDSDGDAVVAAGAASIYGRSGTLLDGRRVALEAGGEVVFEKTSVAWVAGIVDGWSVEACREGARVIGEAVAEFDAKGTIVAVFPPLVSIGALADILSEALGIPRSRISGDAENSVAVFTV